MTELDVIFKDESDPIDFGTTFVHSEAFKTLFRDGMGLVEETAAYLDGPGREEASRLPRRAALAYASESMRLTTRLMQVASWLLVQRAVAEGEITPTQAMAEKNRVRLTKDTTTNRSLDVEALPAPLRDLIESTGRIHARILHLDGLITNERPTPPKDDNAVATQQGLLRSVFEGA